jgi:hypothetical protein
MMLLGRQGEAENGAHHKHDDVDRKGRARRPARHHHRDVDDSSITLDLVHSIACDTIGLSER